MALNNLKRADMPLNKEKKERKINNVYNMSTIKVHKCSETFTLTQRNGLNLRNPEEVVVTLL